MTEITNKDALIDQIAELKKQNTVLKKINYALMERVENHGISLLHTQHLKIQST